MCIMKIIIAGTRTFNNYILLSQIINYYTKNISNFEIVSGCARGVDTLAIKFAKEYNIKVHEFPANWDQYKKRAGYLRNIEMAKFSNALIAIWDGKSRGTKHMIDIADQYQLRKRILIYDSNGNIQTF